MKVIIARSKENATRLLEEEKAKNNKEDSKEEEEVGVETEK